MSYAIDWCMMEMWLHHWQHSCKQQQLHHTMGMQPGLPPVSKAHPLQHEASRCFYTSRVAAPVQQPGRAEVLEDVQALRCSDVPMALLLNLLKHMADDQRAHRSQQING